MLRHKALPYKLIQRRGAVSKNEKSDTQTTISHFLQKFKNDQLIYSCLTNQQDKQCKYAVTMKRVRVTTVAVKTQ